MTAFAFSNLMQRRPKSLSQSAFTLIEMLAVLGIIAVVAGVAAPAVLGVITSTRLTQAGDEIAGFISQAQQIAVSESRPVEVRFYRMTDAKSVGDDASAIYRGVLLLKYFQTGEPDPTALDGSSLASPLAVAEFGGIYRLPSGIEIAESAVLSSIMNLNERPARGGDSGGSARVVVKRAGNYDELEVPEGQAFRSFLCLPEGTDLNANETWFVTMVESNNRDSSPNDLKNFYTIQIEPVTGRLMTYRP